MDNSIIAKTATDVSRFHRDIWPFQNARAALRECLRICGIAGDERVLLPAYIGWSDREGSGVFDPIRELGLKYEFYRINTQLDVDIEDFAAKLGGGTRAVILIHYFGRPDPNLAQIVDLARSAGVTVIEDCAHAMYSAWISNRCGSFGDAAIFSLHKMLPLDYGGLLQMNNPEFLAGLQRMPEPSGVLAKLLRVGIEYDMSAIARSRWDNQAFLRNLLVPLTPHVELLWPNEPAEGVIPQTLPVLIHGRSRNDYYFGLNEAGFGAVSLYQTMIPEINPTSFPEGQWLSQRILNLPLHQDCTRDGFIAMVDCLAKFGPSVDERL